MSFSLRLRSTPAAMLRFRTPLFVARRAAFATSVPRLAGKESSLNHEGRAEEVEKHKEDQLKKQEEGKGHWVDELASDSESAVKADRGEDGLADSNDFAKLQEATKHMPEKKQDS